jgi:hypothetical protein
MNSLSPPCPAGFFICEKNREAKAIFTAKTPRRQGLRKKKSLKNARYLILFFILLGVFASWR